MLSILTIDPSASDEASTAADILANFMHGARHMIVPAANRAAAIEVVRWSATPLETLRVVGAINATPILRRLADRGDMSLVWIDDAAASTLVGKADRAWMARLARSALTLEAAAND